MTARAARTSHHRASDAYRATPRPNGAPPQRATRKPSSHRGPGPSAGTTTLTTARHRRPGPPSSPTYTPSWEFHRAPPRPRSATPTAHCFAATTQTPARPSTKRKTRSPTKRCNRSSPPTPCSTTLPGEPTTTGKPGHEYIQRADDRSSHRTTTTHRASRPSSPVRSAGTEPLTRPRHKRTLGPAHRRIRAAARLNWGHLVPSWRGHFGLTQPSADSPRRSTRRLTVDGSVLPRLRQRRVASPPPPRLVGT